MSRVVVIGAGIGGLTTAALLAQAGLDVTVLEAHVYPGGCAGTFYHQKYRFDAGATLAGGFYPGGPMDVVAKAVGIDAWPAHPSNPAMTVHLPDGDVVTRWGDERRWDERRRAFGEQSDAFWRWQEKTADALWDLAMRSPAWPPQSLAEGIQLVQQGLSWLGSNPQSHLNPLLWADGVRSLAAHLPKGADRKTEKLRQFIDAQLLISAQTTSPHVYGLFGASALDLPRRGVVHFEGGIGRIAECIAQAVRDHGGEVRYRQEVTRIVTEQRGHQRVPVAVETKRGHSFPADIVVANLPPWNIAKLMGEHTPPALQNLPARPTKGSTDGWGAFMIYVGLDNSAVPKDSPLHHQLIAPQTSENQLDSATMGEGNTIFMSLSPEWDAGRAPAGQRALTISTHTNLGKWWDLYENDLDEYTNLKNRYVDQMLMLAERVIPNIRDAAHLIKPGTPVTFNRFTRRQWGWVGGFPQTNLFRTWAPKLDTNLWMVGDSIFPGQSTAAVALGGIRVANAVLAQTDNARVRQPAVRYGAV
ncbi:MAG: NAD(P)/FAD-dependent oxidoreductase [Chloroflexota bacterium]